MTKAFIIAIDGPAASGKGTLARRLSVYFGLRYLDTGRLYRAVALSILDQGLDPQDSVHAAEAARLLSATALESPRLSEEHVGTAASIVAAMPEVRSALIDFQREFAATPPGAVMDGRDIGTVICPNADKKFFIHADVHIRAKRRYKELQEKGSAAIYDSVLRDLQERDARDSGRSTAPLKPAPNAVCIDTGAMDADQVFQHIVSLIALK